MSFVSRPFFRWLLVIVWTGYWCKSSSWFPWVRNLYVPITALSCGAPHTSWCVVASRSLVRVILLPLAPDHSSCSLYWRPSCRDTWQPGELIAPAAPLVTRGFFFILSEYLYLYFVCSYNGASDPDFLEGVSRRICYIRRFRLPCTPLWRYSHFQHSADLAIHSGVKKNRNFLFFDFSFLLE